MGKARTIYGSQLGYYLDGWADIIEGMGSKEEDVRMDVIKQLKERNMPDVTVERVKMKEGIISEWGKRDYIITSTFPGVTTTIYVAKHGNDLFASWRTFTRNILNLVHIIIYLITAIVLTFGYLLITKDISEDLFMVCLTGNILYLILTSMPVFLVILILAIIAGIIMKHNILGYILQEPSLFDKEDISAMNLTVHKILLRALDTAGIDVTELRLKGEYKVGRRGESI